ncbi:glycosyltransferase family 2 protein [Treponema sp.]|uniref:glycosyltransferase family 2 protein n=1 Tax=Treponema sp. TaxID=166 RepID=UPI00298D9906|nr:glycosyltransferase family 2 protein [Treponema sp.]MCR5612539.1 glycosyltransferase [Treponema sp.]
MFVSIVIPVHNRAHTLKKCIDSVLSQSNKDFELILVDDHSTDSSLLICNEYASNDSRIKVFRQSDEKQGAQAARNLGLTKANYDWIMFNDSDDVWRIDKIEKELSVLERYGYDDWIVIYSDCNTVDVDTNEKKYWALPHIDEKKSYKDLLVKSGPMFQSLLCSKKHLDQIGYLDETVPSYQEWDTSIRLAKQGRFIHIKEPLFDYYIGANDAISKSSEKDFIGRCNIYNKFKDEIIRVHGKNTYMKMVSDNLFNAANVSIFDNLKSNNPIIQCYETNLIKYFGVDYKNQIIVVTKKINKKNQYKSIIKKIITKPYKIPVWLFKRLRSKFVKEQVESYQDKINRHIKNYKSTVYFNQDGNDKLLELLSQKKPIFITRFGGFELDCLNAYRNKKGYNDELKHVMRYNTGFFPVNNENLDKFSELYFDAIKSIDCCAVWFNDGEGEILSENVPAALLVELACLNSFLYNNPYTKVLEGKKVLVIHPFENSIKKQFENREKLFANPEVLPQFELKIIKAPQTIAGNTDGYESWFEAFEDTKKKIMACDFDIALIGCGAYGLPLGSYVKSLGKTAIHIGGALQLLFGIKGHRWESQYDYDKRFYNDYWIYPLDSDTPKNSNIVEDNCYWR